MQPLFRKRCHTWSKRVAEVTTCAWSSAKSPPRCCRLKWACSSALDLVCGSVYRGASTATGACISSFRTASSSPGRMARSSNSDADERISRRPYTAVEYPESGFGVCILTNYVNDETEALQYRTVNYI